MEAKIVERGPMRVMGITARIEPMTADYKDLWGRQFGSRAKEIGGVALSGACYGVYFGTDEPGKVDFIAGMAVADDAPLPAGLVAREVPGGTYASFQCAIATIGPTWGAIYREWLPSSSYAEDEARPSLEEYPPDSTGAPDSTLTVFLPVRRR